MIVVQRLLDYSSSKVIIRQVFYQKILIDGFVETFNGSSVLGVHN